MSSPAICCAYADHGHTTSCRVGAEKARREMGPTASGIAWLGPMPERKEAK